MLLVALVILHALFGIFWFGLSLRLQSQARLAVDASMPRDVIAQDGGRTVQAMTVASIVFYALAVGAFFTGGGFSAYTPVYHTALLLGLALVLVQVLMIQPTWTRLGGGEASARKRLAMGLGIGHALWLILFVLMFFGSKWISYWSL